MKKIFSIIVSMLCFVVVLTSQTIPQGINFQAVARDADGEILANQTISLKLSLKSHQPADQVYYVETHRVTTNAFGLFDLVIGQGEQMEGSFERVPWSSQHILMETAMDAKGGTDFKVLATTNLLAVPYAFHAQTAAGIAGELPEEEGGEKSDRPAPCPTKTCYCEGGYTEMKVFYFGEDNVTVEVYSDYALNDLFLTFNNVLSGDLLVIDGTGLSNGKLASNTYFKVITATGEDCITKIRSRCPVNSWPEAKKDQEVLGKTFGNFTVYSHTSQEDNYECIIDEIETDWHVGGNIVGPANKKLGTRNEEDVIFVTNDISRGIIKRNGQFGVKTLEPRPGIDLDVRGVLAVTDNVPDGGHVAIFENTHGSNGDGIKIKINTDEANNGNDFVSFWDNSGMRGRIEGQTAGELVSDPEWIVNTTILSTEVAIATAELGMATADLFAANTSTTPCIGFGACETVPIASLITAAAANEGVAIANEASAIANLAAYEAFALANLGVTYESGAGDYAEWLQVLNPNEELRAGDIVGVHGGKITKKTEGADNFMVVSFNPIVLGKMPQPDDDNRYEKVGFMGQVIVKVLGPVDVGDYIIPSGFNDGFGKGVKPQMMTAEDYGKIVGVAWSASDNKVSGVVNLAIGINQNDVADIVVEQQKEIEELRVELQSMQNGFDKLMQEMQSLKNEVKTIGVGAIDPEDFSRNATAEELHAHMLSREQVEASFELMRTNLIDQGIDVDNHPIYGRVFHDETYREQIIQKILQSAERGRNLMIEIDKQEGF